MANYAKGRLFQAKGSTNGKTASVPIRFVSTQGFTREGVEYPHHSPGIYDVRCSLVQGPEWLREHRRWSIRLECNFLLGEGNVSGFLNLGDDPKRFCVRRQSNYFKLWCKVNGGLPRKGQAMDWNDFIGKFFRVRVGDATKNSKGELLPEAERYSKVVEFLELVGP